MVTRGRLFDVSGLPGFVALRNADWLGYATYQIDGDELEIAMLQSIIPGAGAGSALIAACIALARSQRLAHVWLVTTNDNLDALRFYQHRGFRLAALRPDAVTRARESLKTEIGLIGESGIPIRDEIELYLPPTEWPYFVERYGWPSS